MRSILIGLVLVTTMLAQSAVAEVRITTWNAREVFDPAAATGRADDLEMAANSLSPDILILQEVASCAAAEAVRNLMRLDRYHVACSDFTPDGPKNRHAAFEVAILSRYAFGAIIESDPTPDGVAAGHQEELLTAAAGVAPVETDRGYLWAHVPELNLHLAAIHLKSSRGAVGQRDLDNARQREFVAAHLAARIARLVRAEPSAAVLVAGDFNVGHSDRAKNGRDLANDCYLSTCTPRDGYDDTHALFSAGLVDGLRMRNLAAGIATSTYPRYPGSPIDNIYVVDPADVFAAARSSPTTFGSDHRAVSTVMDGPQATFAAPATPLGPLAIATAPAASYYAEVDATSAAAFRQTLHQTIAKARRLSYREIWDALAYTDADPNRAGHVILLYGGKSVPVTDWERTNKGQDAWNREHVWPRSRGLSKETLAAHNDLHHLRPSDRRVNSRRGARDFDAGGLPVPDSPGSRADADSFEPPDEEKGDIARMVLYMAIRYEGEGAQGNLEPHEQASQSGPRLGRLCILLRWHESDPVSAWERRRNDRIFELQGNRNPFIDNPVWAHQIWGDRCT